MGFRGTANSRKPAVGKNLFQAPFAGLRSKGKANFLAQRCCRRRPRYRGKALDDRDIVATPRKSSIYFPELLSAIGGKTFTARWIVSIRKGRVSATAPSHFVLRNSSNCGINFVDVP
jgi:hypothetical protein